MYSLMNLYYSCHLYYTCDENGEIIKLKSCGSIMFLYSDIICIQISQNA